MENYQKAADSLGDATANGVAGMYSFLNKIKQLNSNLSEVDRIADEVFVFHSFYLNNLLVFLNLINK